MTESESGAPRRDRWFWATAFVLLPALVFAVYAKTFSGYPVVLTQLDIVADADASLWSRVLREYAPDHVFGQSTRGPGRGGADITQAHKEKHLLYAIVGHQLYRGFSRIWPFRGDDAAALLAVNAAISALNMALFLLLARSLGWGPGVAVPISLLYAFAIGPWTIGSLPESWPLSATIWLALLVLVFRAERVALPAGLVAGIGMLNNATLGIGLLALPVRDLARGRSLRVAVQRFAVAASLAWLVFLGSLTLASRADPAFRPDRYVAMLAWFGERNAGLLEEREEPGPWRPRALGNSITLAFGTAVVSNQAKMFYPTRSWFMTLREGALGAAGVLAEIGLALLAFAALAVRLRAPGPGRRAVLRILPILVLLPVHWIITHGAYWPAAVLCSPPLVPLLLLVLGAGLAQLPPRLLPIAWVATPVLLANNAVQMRRIDEGLGRIEESRGIAWSVKGARVAGAAPPSDRLHSGAP